MGNGGSIFCKTLERAPECDVPKSTFVFGTGEPNREAREAIARFAAAYPDVAIPFPLIETWPSEMFSVPAHVEREHTDLIGNRLGEALAEIVR